MPALVYNLAADMGGMGFIENNKAACMLSVLTSTHLLVAARDAGVERFFYASSACVYAAGHQTGRDVDGARARTTPTRRCPRTATAGRSCSPSAWPAISCEDFGLQTRVARYHNVYGPHGTYAGGREKAPAAICRKVIEAKLSGDQHHRDLGRRRADAAASCTSTTASTARSCSPPATSASR